MSTYSDLKSARGLYASAPSHAGPGECPERGSSCLVQALQRTVHTTEGSYYDARSAMAIAAGSTPDAFNPIAWNASHSTARVLAAFDKAIAALEPKSEPEGWAVFFIGFGSYEGELSRVRTGLGDTSNLWPGDNPTDAAQRLHDRYPGTYETVTLYVNKQCGNDIDTLVRVRFEYTPAKYKAVAS